MLQEFQGAEIFCDVVDCEMSERDEFAKRQRVNSIEKIKRFERELTKEGWEVVENQDLCPKHAREYANAENKRQWLVDNEIL